MSQKSEEKDKKETPKSGRRGFLKLGLLAAGLTAVGGGLQEALSEEKITAKSDGGEKMKMLTPDGKLVEIDKSLFDKLSTKKKASNSEIYQWMNNPSKDNNI
ncbi:MAG: hypothetical protein PSX36_06315 [bacterium]|nr:hypothetical protein [bacterium]